MDDCTHFTGQAAERIRSLQGVTQEVGGTGGIWAWQWGCMVLPKHGFCIATVCRGTDILSLHPYNNMMW